MDRHKHKQFHGIECAVVNIFSFKFFFFFSWKNVHVLFYYFFLAFALINCWFLVHSLIRHCMSQVLLEQTISFFVSIVDLKLVSSHTWWNIESNRKITQRICLHCVYGHVAHLRILVHITLQTWYVNQCNGLCIKRMFPFGSEFQIPEQHEIWLQFKAFCAYCILLHTNKTHRQTAFAH